MTTIGSNKKGLKLRKEIGGGLQNGLTQARSASQGRTGTRQITHNNLVGQGQSRNQAGGLTEYNSYGAMPASNGKLSRAHDVYNSHVKTQNIS